MPPLQPDDNAILTAAFEAMTDAVCGGESVGAVIRYYRFKGGSSPVKWCKITVCVKSVTALSLSLPGSVSPVVAPSRDAALDLLVTLDLAPSGRVSAARGQSQDLRVAYTHPLQA